jgi:hypothetical protein
MTDTALYKYGGELFVQIRGVAMGENWAVDLTNLLLGIMEYQFIKRLHGLHHPEIVGFVYWYR